MDNDGTDERTGNKLETLCTSWSHFQFFFFAPNLKLTILTDNQFVTLFFFC